jgi:two-component system chemotaxis response regulator CheY
MQTTIMNGSADNVPMVLPAVLDLTAAEGFLESMRQRLHDAEPLRIDASAVETLTFPCIQIILSAKKSRDRIWIERPSEAFMSAFADLGLDWAQGQEEIPDQIQEQAADEGETRGEGPIDDHQTKECIMAKRILTIDDSKTMRDMLMLTLADAGFDVLQAVDGQDGLDVLGNERVDIIITDINMPRMDGYEVIRHLRRNPDHKTTPILVLTTESEAEKKNLAREAGATGWMVKPFDPDRLVATIRKVAP